MKRMNIAQLVDDIKTKLDVADKMLEAGKLDYVSLQLYEARCMLQDLASSIVKLRDNLTHFGATDGRI